MRQIWSVKKNEEAAAKKKPKMSAAQLRVQKGMSLLLLSLGLEWLFGAPLPSRAGHTERLIFSFSVQANDADLTELELPNTMTTHFPDPTDVLNFNLTITPDEGE
jgi:ubiquitin-conjugating enzyme E2 M